jgi:predicted dehydrogenase
MSEQVVLGIIGCGAISAAYFKGAQAASQFLRIKSCADLFPAAAEAKAKEYGCQAVSVADLLADPEIEIVVNLTIPRAHVATGLQAIAAGKHHYSEKPFGVDVKEARKLWVAAAKKGLRLGCAPDTFLGQGIQACRKLLDEGAIGKVVGGVTNFACHGHESWHPNPAFYYDLGGGPMLDMGPYYMTALVCLLGPVKRVTACTSRAYNERIATCEAKKGLKIDVKVETHQTGVVEFHCGAQITVIMSFDMWRHHLPRFELYGLDGSMTVPDPNGFGGPVTIWKPGMQDWQEQALPHAQNARMFGVVDMARAIRTGRPHRASGDLAFHVLEVMEAFTVSSAKGRHVNIRTSCKRPEALPVGLPPWTAD